MVLLTFISQMGQKKNPKNRPTNPSFFKQMWTNRQFFFALFVFQSGGYCYLEQSKWWIYCATW